VYPLVFAVCFPLIVYSAEARGYSPAVAFALGMYALFEDPADPSFGRIAGLWLCIVLGFLAHLTFLYAYGALCFWSVFRCVRSRLGLRRSTIRLLSLHGAPCLFLTALMIKVSTAPAGRLALWPRADRDFRLAVGAPALIGVVPLAVIAALVLAWDTRARYRSGSDSFVFFPIAVVFVLLVLTLVREPRLLAPRYFLVSIALFLLPLCAALAQLVHSRRAVGTAALLVVLATNLASAGRFIELGRGHYSDALRYMAVHTPGAEIVIGSDHDVRNQPLLAYYSQWLRSGQRVVYVPHAEREPRAPHWLILQSFDQPPAPRGALVVKSGAAYRLRRTFPYWGPSGCHRFVYERIAEPAAGVTRT
jgi:hypothetical protein